MSSHVEVVIFMVILLITMKMTTIYFEILLPDKHNAVIETAAAWMAYFLYQTIAVFSKPLITPEILFWNFMILLLICMAAYRGSMKRKVLYVLLLQANFIIVKNSVGAILDAFHVEQTGILLISDAAVLLVLGLFVLGLKKRNRVILPEPSVKEWLFWLSLPLFFMYTFRKPSFPLTVLYVLFMNFTICNAYDSAVKGLVAEKQKEQFERQLLQCEKMSNSREVSYQESRRMRHDLKAYLLSVREYIVQSELDHAVRVIDDLIGKNTIYREGRYKSGNMMIDSIMNSKYAEAKMRGVDIDSSVAVPSVLSFDGSDICIMIGNLLDNAIDAAEQLEQKDRQVQITIGIVKGALVISVSNRYLGAVKKDADGALVTTKQDKKNHGFGLISVKNIVEKYGGELLCKQEDNIFRAIIMLYMDEMSSEDLMNPWSG